MSKYSTIGGTPGFHRSSQKLRLENAFSEIAEVPVLLAKARTNLGLTGGTLYATTATAAGTTTLTATSAEDQYFTGTTTQTVVLPVSSTLQLGQTFLLVNNSTGIVTVQTSGGNNLLFLQPGARAEVSAIAISGTGTSSWSITNLPNRTAVANTSVTSQAPAATTRTYITGSGLTIPAGGLQIGSIFKFRFNMTKTAAGSASSTIDVAIGTAGTTADTAVLSFTKPAGTAAADEGFVTLDVIIRGPISASCIAVGEFQLTHNLAATGHAQIPCVVVNTVSSTFDATIAGLKIGVCLTSGASDAITIQQVTAESANLRS